MINTAGYSSKKNQSSFNKPRNNGGKYLKRAKNLQLFYVFNKNVFNKIKRIPKTHNKPTKIHPTIQPIIPIYLEEREWFKRKYERDIGKITPEKETETSELQRCATCQKMINDCGLDNLLYEEYQVQPKSNYIPDIKWSGPLMTHCGCPISDCECRGDMFLPPKPIPRVKASRSTWLLDYYLQMLTRNKRQPSRIHKPGMTFPERLHNFVNAEINALTKLQELGALENRGAEFCLNRCFNYELPEARKDNMFITLKNQLLQEYKNKLLAPVIEEVKVEDIDAPIIDGFYRSLSTQSTTDENGEFIIDKISHLLFASLDNYMLRDIEGKKINIFSHDKFQEVARTENMAAKLDSLFTFQGIKSRFSKLTSGILTSILEIKDTGVPMNSRATQDPPLTDDYQSIVKISSKESLVYPKRGRNKEACPYCKFYSDLKSFKESDLQGSANSEMLSNSEDKFKATTNEPKKLSDVGMDVARHILDNIIDDITLISSNIPNTEKKIKYHDINMQRSKTLNDDEINNQKSETTKVKMNDGNNEKPSEGLINNVIEPVNSLDNSNNNKEYIDPRDHELQNIKQGKDPSKSKEVIKKLTFNTSHTNVNVQLTDRIRFQYQFTQKPSTSKTILKNRQLLPDKRRKSLSLDDFKVNVKRSFRKTTSAFSSFFKCLSFTQKTVFDSTQSHTTKNDICHDSGKNDSKISEQEMYSLQYNSQLMTDAENSESQGNVAN